MAEESLSSSSSSSYHNGEITNSLLLEAGLLGLSISESSPLLARPTSSSCSSSSNNSDMDVSPCCNNNNVNNVNQNDNHHHVHSMRPSIQLLPGMQLRAHVLEKGIRRVRPVPVKEAIKRKSKNGLYWIDIDADQNKDREEMNAWLHQLPFLPAFILSRLAEPSQTWVSQVVALDTAILAVIRILPMEESSEEIAYMAAVVVNQLLLTFTSGPRRDIGGLYDRALSYMNARENPTNSTDALFGWMYFHVERTSRSLRELRYQVLKMDESMDRDISSVHFRELIDAKDQLLKIFGVAEEQHECLEALVQAATTTTTTTGNSSSSMAFAPGTLAVLVAQSAAAERMAVRLEKHLGDLRQRHESHQHDGMNRRLAILTAMSAVFLPLTLITGIWGMNFEYMPELKSPYAYPIALSFMLTLAITMVCCFRRAGWFD